MVKEKNDRFQLSKESKRSFDTSKKKRTFDLTKDEVVTAPIPEPATTTTQVAETPGKKKKWWILVLLLLVVAGAAAYLLSTDDGKGDDTTDTTDTTNVVPTTEPDEAGEPETVDVDTPEDDSAGVNQNAQPDNTSETQGGVQVASPDVQDDAKKEPEQTKPADVVKPVDAGEQNVNTTTSVKMTDEVVRQKAVQVIRGDYGNGEVRKQRLGTDYDVIQREVNKIYRDYI